MNHKHIYAVLLFSCACVFAAYGQSVSEQDYEAMRDKVLMQIKAPAEPALSVSIIKFGAKGDSLTDCLPAFKKAFKRCKAQGGLKIIVPAGTYFIRGPLLLVDNLQLHLEKGARLKFSENPGDYLPAVFTSWEGTFLYNYSPLIYGYGLSNVLITGQGVIDGNAARTFSTWRDKQKAAQMLSRDMNHQGAPYAERRFGEGSYLRPQLVQLFRCKNVLIQGVHVTNSPFWCIHLLQSENITVRGISFNAKNINNDGIDPEYSRNILIEDVDFDNGDDNVAIKAGRDHEGRSMATPSENIVIRNCRFKGLHAVVAGSEMSAGVRNVFVENCTSAGYCKRGIYLKSNPDRGGFISNIFVRNLRFTEVEDLFYVTSFYHGEGQGFATDIHDVYVDGLSCGKVRNAAIVIQGFPEKKVNRIGFKNVMVDYAKIGVSINNAENINLTDVNIGGIVNEAPSSAH
ncbi:MAG: glycoside hydrolase family 28 [Bacteroidetes bacterium]|nr:glycoside hydrolase family 28 [Bacteroidota bacterium]